MRPGRTALVTGAADGMGAKFARRFLNNGDPAIASDTGEEALAELSSTLANKHLNVRKGDITSEEDTAALPAFAAKKGGGIDMLINVAGFFPVLSVLEMTATHWRKIITINLTGTAQMFKAALLRLGPASIYSGLTGQAHSIAAKAGTFGLSRSVARELGPEGITVNAVERCFTISRLRKDLSAGIAGYRHQGALPQPEGKC